VEFRIDFSGIDFIYLSRLDIKFDEVYSILNNEGSYFEPKDDFVLVLGFSSRKKFIKMAFRISGNANFEIEALQIELPDEEDIRESWCGRK
jgi:predicted KAP-like P-loop ATPase